MTKRGVVAPDRLPFCAIFTDCGVVGNDIDEF